MFFIQLLLLLKSSRKGKSKDFKNNLSRSSHSWLVDDFSSVEWMSFITRNKIELLLKCLGGEEWWVLKFRRITFGSIHFWQTWARFRDEKLEENRQKYWMFLLLPSLKDWAICHFTSYLFFFLLFRFVSPFIISVPNRTECSLDCFLFENWSILQLRICLFFYLIWHCSIFYPFSSSE